MNKDKDRVDVKVDASYDIECIKAGAIVPNGDISMIKANDCGGVIVDREIYDRLVAIEHKISLILKEKDAG